MFANLIKADEFAARQLVTPQTKRLHRRQGTRRVVNGMVTGVDSQGFRWIKLGRVVWYLGDKAEQRVSGR